MVSGTAPTTSKANVVVVVVINFLLNSGFYNLMLNDNVIGCFGNLQQEGIVGMIEIVLVKGANINDQIITWLSNFEATGVTCIVGFRFCVCSRVERYLQTKRAKAMLSSSESSHVLITIRTS